MNNNWPNVFSDPITGHAVSQCRESVECVLMGHASTIVQTQNTFLSSLLVYLYLDYLKHKCVQANTV